MQKSDIAAKVRQSCFSDPFSLQSKQLQPDYVSSYRITKAKPFPAGFNLPGIVWLWLGEQNRL
jgi:hypothetical protein